MRAKKNPSNGSAEKTVKAILRATRRQYAAEEKIRMVLEGLRGEIVSLRWERIDLDRRILRVEETKTREVLELPITRQLAAILDRRLAEAQSPLSGKPLTGWLFPSTKSRSGHIEDVPKFYAAITEAAGTKFWFHGLRNSFISVTERELLLLRSLTKRLVNHSRGSDVTEGYAADWTVEQLRELAQRIADRINALMQRDPKGGDMSHAPL